jgi:DNA-binding CsgD family transcriptional regulator
MQKLNLPNTNSAEVGLVLMDLSLKFIACDRGAAVILNAPNQPGVDLETASWIPVELLDMLRSRKPTDASPIKTHLRIGLFEYVCRAYLLDGQEGAFLQGALTQPIVALHLEKDSSANDAAYEVGSRYHLTEREMEALKGILVGLGSKEVAERMNISPNTVKAFLRLIMIKMGVTTRAGIVAKVLQNRATAEEAGGPSTANPQRPARKEASAANGAGAATAPTSAGEHWRERIGDPTGTEGIGDRLMHSSFRMNLTGDSSPKKGGRKPGGEPR